MADSGNGSIRRISPSGVVSTFAAGFYEPVGVGVAADGTAYVTDSAVGTLYRTGGGSRTLLAGAEWTLGDSEGSGASARLRPLDGVAVGGGYVLFADGGNYRVRAFALDGTNRVSTFAGNGRAGLGLGTGASANVANPRGIAAYPGGFAIADSGNHRVVSVRP